MSSEKVNDAASIAAVTTGTARPQIRIDTTAETGSLTVQTRDPRVETAQSSIVNLGDADTKALHARMEPLPDLDAANANAPAMRPPSMPPAGAPAQPIAFVVPTGKAVSDAPIAPGKVQTPLAPPQITPQGDVRYASEIRVRFSEPMVPVAAVGKAALPKITIEPAATGEWRWIDTRVVQFTAAPRLAQATEYTVTVQPGVEAISGAKLATATSQKFATGPIRILSSFPGSTIRTDSPIVISFDQAFDAAKILPKLRVTRVSGQRIPHVVTTLDAAHIAWAKNPSLEHVLKQPHGFPRSVVLAPQGQWPAGTQIHVILDKGAPSAEGPRLSTEQSFAKFDVAPHFKVEGITCGTLEKPRMFGAICPAKGYVTVQFSSSILPSSYRAEKVQIAGQDFEDNKPAGSSVSLYAPNAIGRAFTIPVGDGLIDIYGQPLIGARTVGFTTGPERFFPYLDAADGMHVLDPRWQIPQWIVKSEAVTSVRIQLYQVTPKDYFAFRAFEAKERATPPGKPVFDKTYAIGPRNGADLRVDLRPALDKNGLGHVIAIATNTAPNLDPDHRREVAWLQVSKLGLSARIDRERVSAWVQDITPQTRFLAPIEGATTTLLVENSADVRSAKSDAAGHATLDLVAPVTRKPTDKEPAALLIAQQGDDTVFAVMNSHEKTIRVDNALWYVTDDRFTYKPGETVYVKGWVRWTHNGVNPGLAMPRPGDTIAYTLADVKGGKIASGTAALTDHGGFHVQVDIPKTANLGTAYFTFSTRDQRHRHPIAVQEFRTPAFSVSLDDDVSHSGATPLILGESIEMQSTARYYAGGGLGGAAIRWDATLSTTRYAPPGWARFAFDPPRSRASSRYSYDHHTTDAHQAGSLSGASTANVVWGIAALPKNLPSLLSVDATVTDVDRMSIRASSRPILVHPSAYYVGLRLKPGTHDTIEAIVTDIDGTAVPNVAVTVDIEGVLGSERYRDDAKVIDSHQCTLTSTDAPVTCSFKRKDFRTAYTARAKIADARGRVNAAHYQVPWWSTDDKRDLTIVPDKPKYRPGDIAKLDIRSTVLPAVAVVSFLRGGMIAQKRVELTTASTTVELPIEVSHIQNIIVSVDRYAKRRHQWSSKNKPLPPLPEATSAEVTLDVDVESARLDMRTRPTQKLVQPGEEATFEVDVRHRDKPVAGAEVALLVVDEAVLALSAKHHADPLAPFYRQAHANTWTLSSLGNVLDSGMHLDGAPGFELYTLDNRGGFGTGTGSGYGSGYGTIGHGMGGGGSSVVTARKDFRATAVFSPTLKTDANGRASVTVKMPDSLTRFRIVALATHDAYYFGKAESTIVTQRKVNARTVAPRFLAQGDTFALPIVVQNLDGKPRTVDVAVRAANLVSRGPAGKRVTIPAGQRAEVRFEFSTKARGKAVIQTILVSGAFADASNVELPIYEPATTESFATYGVVEDKPQREQLAVPQSVFTDVGGVEVEVSSTQLQSLTDAYWYLYAYPYECAEQRSGRMLATAAMYDLLDAFATAGRPTKAEIDAQRTKDAAVLAKTQRPDGGWGYFGGMTTDDMVTMQVLQALGAQKIAGPTTQKAIAYVTKQSTAMFTRLEKAAALPPPQRKDRLGLPGLVSAAAMSLTVLGQAGIDVRPRAERLHALATTLDAYPIDAKARVLSIVAKVGAVATRKKLLADLLSATHETASSATVTASYVESERLLLVSSTKTNALALDALMREAPDHALITKLARGVLDGRKHGRWSSTQENLVALQAMRRYFDTYEKVAPNYTGKLWLGTASYAEQPFVGRTTARGVAKASWTTLVPGTTHDIALQRDGDAGRMYYRVGITYAPKEVNLPALDAGFIVRRTYTAADDPKDVVKQADGSYKIKLGAKVVVTLEALNTTTRHAVALVDPLPAGFEAINSALAIAERPADVGLSDWWSHVNMRDNRVEAFQMELPAGTHRFVYSVRATTPGRFVAAPTKAEEMYSPETFGRSTGTTVVVE